MFNNIKNRTIDFVGNKKAYFAVPAILLVLTIFFLVFFGLEIDIQFKGGSMITYSYEDAVNINDVKSAIEGKIGNVLLQESNDAVGGIDKIIVSSTTNISTEQLSELNESLEKDFGVKYVESSTVDPTIGTEFL